ncbi:MAG: hypothetical protein U0W40_08585 [Acidimicrobiia bacterium]
MSRRLVTMVVGIGAMAFALAGCFGNGTTPTNTGQPGSVGAGLYRTIGDKGGPCTVTRVDAANAPHVYSNATGGPLYIRVKPDDKSITSSACEPWLLAPFVSPIFVTSTPGSFVRSGDYRIGYEMKPGTYKAPGYTGNGACKWQVVDDFTHDGLNVKFGSQPADETTPGVVTIQVSSSDFGFTSEGCGDWTKQ